MLGQKVAIVGAGRMGSLLAERIPAACRKVIISQRKEKAVQLADEVGGLASDQISAVRGCEVVFVAVPGGAVHQVVQEARPHLEAGALVVNMAPEIPTGELAHAFPRIRFAAAKVIGHTDEMQAGAVGLVLLDHLDEGDEELLGWLLEGMGRVMRGEESRVQAVHSAVADVLVRAETELRGRLEALGFDRDAARSVLTAMGPGVLRSLAAGEPAAFMEGALRADRTAMADLTY